MTLAGAILRVKVQTQNGWQLCRLKQWVRLNQAQLPETTNPERGFRYIDIGTVQGGELIRPPSLIKFGDAPSRARRVVKKDDVIIATVRPYLKAIYRIPDNDKDLIVSTGFAVLSPTDDIDSSFLYYTILNQQFVDLVTAHSVGANYPAIAPSKLGSLELSVPPIEEQRAIARFLDRQDRRINRFIRAKRRLIELLNEQKQAIIHQAVTRGLDPDVPLKPSGVDWLGDIPAHWEVRSIKSCLESVTSGLWGADAPQSDDDVQVPCVRVADFDMVSLTTRNIIPTTRAVPKSAFMLRQLKRGDLLIEKSGGGDNQPVGRVVMYGLDEAAICSNFISRLCPKGPVIRSEFLLYVMHVLQSTRRNVPSIKQTTGIQNLDQSHYFSNSIPIPTLAEQDLIIAAIRQRSERLLHAVSRTQREIELIREYRTRLIADVVTGKLDVRNHPDAAETVTDDLPDDGSFEPLDDELLDELRDLDFEVPADEEEEVSYAHD